MLRYGRKGAESVLYEIDKDKGKIVDFISFGSQDNQLCVLSDKGHLIVLEYDQKRSQEVIETKIDLIKKRKESCLTLAICDDSQYIAVHIRDNDKSMTSRIIIFSLINTKKLKQLEAVNQVDLYSERLGVIWALRFSQYYGSHIVLLAMTYACPSRLLIFDFNAENNQFGEVRTFRKIIGNGNLPLKVARVGDLFYSSDYNANFIKIGFFFD